MDGVAGGLAVFEAINGITRDFGYPPPGSRGRMEGLLVDLWDALRGLPEVFRALLALILIVLRRDTGAAGQTGKPPTVSDGADEPIVTPSGRRLRSGDLGFLCSRSERVQWFAVRVLCYRLAQLMAGCG
ncbi:hypothetical protein I551_8739 [Mycobacterium ulcerans str. Harvey]|uniref:Uncharacterized protein n=1 Tax=Mycobacterium ulcerans str. Harvey TaxID=1299332 RepID=A0ABN0RAB8_MYCUL|nr:hypothetical protein I551_8739 [Mycobacterium ulcerans str. Harvey]